MKKGKKYFDYKTTNKSFLKLQRLLQRKGIEDNNFMLEIKNPDLIGIDPYDESLPQEMKHLIFKECCENIWYFLREVAKVIYQTGEKPVIDKVTLDISKLAQAYLFDMGISSYVTTPRQTGRDLFTCILNEYEILFKGRDTSIAYLSISVDNSKLLLQKTYDHINLLPPYLVDSIGKCVDVLSYNLNGIKARIKSAGLGKLQASHVARGLTEHIVYMNDFEYMKNPDVLIKESMPLYYGSYANIMDINQKMYMISSISNSVKTESGKKAKIVRDNCLEWQDKMFDMTRYEILNLLSGLYPIVYIEKSYKELNIGKEYIDRMRKCLGENEEAFRREVLLIRE